MHLCIYEKIKTSYIVTQGFPVVIKVPMKRNFLFVLTKEHKKFGRLSFTVSQYLIWFWSYKALKMLKSSQKVWTRNMRFL